MQYNCALLVQGRLFNDLNSRARRSTTKTIRVPVPMHGFIHTADPSTSFAPCAYKDRLPVNMLMRISLCMCMQGMTRTKKPLEGSGQT